VELADTEASELCKYKIRQASAGQMGYPGKRSASTTRKGMPSLQPGAVSLKAEKGIALQLGVPCFYVLKNPDTVASERQRKVMEILITLLNDA